MEKEIKSLYESVETVLKERIIAEEKNTFPQDVVLETTTFCNLKCIMCSNQRMTRKKSTMRWPLYIKIIEEIAEKAKDTVRLWLCFQGEPLMDKGFSDRVIFAKQKGIKNIVINSNMNLMTKELSEELVKAGLNNIFVGLDATTADVYSKIRVGGNFNRVVENIIYYKEMLDKYGTKEQKITVQFIIMPENEHQAEEVVEFWSKYDIQVKLRPLVTWLGTAVDKSIDKNATLRLPCHWNLNILAATADGYVGWCGCDYDAKGISGNLNNNTIEEIWNTEKKEQRRIQLAGEWDKLPEFCLNCDDWNGGYAKYK